LGRSDIRALTFVDMVCDARAPANRGGHRGLTSPPRAGRISASPIRFRAEPTVRAPS